MVLGLLTKQFLARPQALKTRLLAGYVHEPKSQLFQGNLHDSYIESGDFMRFTVILYCFVCLLCFSLQFQDLQPQQSIKLASNPNISPDGSQITHS